MQLDIVTLMMANLLFSVQVAPLVVVVATAIRSILLLTGKRRVFEEWTRNPLLSAVTIIFAPGMVITTAVRYGVTSLLGIDLEGIGGGGTYGELSLFLKVDKPPRVAILLSALYISTVISVFIALALLVVPVVMLAGAPIVLLCWYVALGVLLSSSLKGGDLTLLGAAIKGRPRSGAIELLAVVAILVLFYTQVVGVIQ
ncbi:MAG: hypothetical protein ACXADD_13330 [Candidatus Thorarchaeota archaeon]